MKKRRLQSKSEPTKVEGSCSRSEMLIEAISKCESVLLRVAALTLLAICLYKIIREEITNVRTDGDLRPHPENISSDKKSLNP